MYDNYYTNPTSLQVANGMCNVHDWRSDKYAARGVICNMHAHSFGGTAGSQDHQQQDH